MRPPMVHLAVTHAGGTLVQFIFVLHLIILPYTTKTGWGPRLPKDHTGRPCRLAAAEATLWGASESRVYRYGFSRTAGISDRCEGGQFFARCGATVPDATRGQPGYPKTRGLSGPTAVRAWRAPGADDRCGHAAEGVCRAAAESS